MTNTIAELAKSCGADLQPPLPTTEIIAFRLRSDGGLTVTLASGETLHACGPKELPPEWRDKNDQMLATLRRVVSAGRIEPEITYHRRQTELADGLFGIAFTEAGR